MNGRLTDEQIVEASRQAFLEEAREMLAQLEGALLALADGEDPEIVNAAFRAAHTIKGSAGLFGYHRVVAFSHEVESLLDRVRSGDVRVTDPVVTLLLECRDHVQRLLDEVAGSEQCEDHDAESARLGALLRRAAGDDVSVPAAPPPAPAASAPALSRNATTAAEAALAAESTSAAADDAWLIHVRFGTQTFVNGFDPLSFIRYLPTVGEVLHIESLVDAVPPLPALDPEQCHLAFAIRLGGAAGKADIEAAFRFAADDCTLRLLPPRSRLDDMLRLVESVTDHGERLGEILVRIGALTPAELDRLLALQAGAAEPTRLGELAVAQGAAEPQVVQAVVARQEKLRQKGSDESRHVRVPADKLDRLITLIGELAIAGSSAQVMAQRLADAPLLEVTERMAQLVESARDDALRLRMVPIGETFTRFRRVVRDVSAQLGKEVSLRITGGDAELDKAMVELIADPLMHLVRNALDHGLETPAQRVAAGKPAAGELHLHAAQEAGAIVIEVGDDGRGLDTARILAKAIERGLVAPGADLPEADIVQLIFQPGFSTAEQVTDLSGRGVGMDVVRRNIEALRGEVTVANRPGHGATVQIRLPLTLAMIDGFRIEVAGASFIVPLEQVVECIESPPEAARLETQALAGCFDLRGEVLPFLHLRRRFRLEGTPCERPSVVVVRCNGRKTGLLVDRLLGEHQTVIKPLGRLFRKLPGISGSTILGSGDVALILDVPSLVPPRSGGPPRAPATPIHRDTRAATAAAVA